MRRDGRRPSEDGSRAGTVYFTQSEDNLRKKIALPWVSFCSDSASLAPEGVSLKSSTHPRAYGSFARLLGRFVREEKRRGEEPHDPGSLPLARDRAYRLTTRFSRWKVHEWRRERSGHPPKAFQAAGNVLGGSDLGSPPAGDVLGGSDLWFPPAADVLGGFDLWLPPAGLALGGSDQPFPRAEDVFGGSVRPCLPGGRILLKKYDVDYDERYVWD